MDIHAIPCYSPCEISSLWNIRYQRFFLHWFLIGGKVLKCTLHVCRYLCSQCCLDNGQTLTGYFSYHSKWWICWLINLYVAVMCWPWCLSSDNFVCIEILIDLSLSFVVINNGVCTKVHCVIVYCHWYWNTVMFSKYRFFSNYILEMKLKAT